MQSGQSFTASASNPSMIGQIGKERFTNYVDSFQSDGKDCLLQSLKSEADMAVIHKEMVDQTQVKEYDQNLQTPQKAKEKQQGKKVSQDESIWAPTTFIKSMFENLIHEDKKLENIQQLWDYLNINLPGFMRKNLPHYEVAMPNRPGQDCKVLQFSLRKNDGSVLACSIKEKNNRLHAESPFIMSFSIPKKDKRKEDIGWKRMSRSHGDLENSFYISNKQTERRDNTSAQKTYHPSNTYRSMESSRKYDDDRMNLLDSLLVSEGGSMQNIPDEKDFPEKMNKHIDDFVNQHLDSTKDWTDLKKILRAKFRRQEGITSKKVRRYLRKIWKVVKNLDEVATDIMEKKVDITFVETPFSSTVKEIAISETSIVNFVRDIAWAPLTYHSYDMFRDREESDSITQTMTQMVISMAAMLFGAIVYHIVRGTFFPRVEEEEEEEEEGEEKEKGSPGLITFIKSVFIWLGAGLAIPGWNLFQYYGVQIGLNMNLGNSGAGYFSSLFPGIPEGPIQGVMSVISSNTLSRSWHKYTLRTFLKQLLIFGTFGAVPGDVWQLSYQIITGPIDAYGDLPDWGITLILGLGLAIAVYIGNVSFGTAYERVINKSHLIIELEAIEDSIDLKPSMIKKDNDKVVSYNGRPGAPTKSSVIILKHDHHNMTPHHSRPHHHHIHDLTPANCTPANRTPANRTPASRTPASRTQVSPHQSYQANHNHYLSPESQEP